MMNLYDQEKIQTVFSVLKISIQNSYKRKIHFAYLKRFIPCCLENVKLYSRRNNLLSRASKKVQLYHNLI